MNHLDEQVEAMKFMLGAAGGHFWIPEEAPDDVKREFLRIIRECPECLAALAKRG